MNEVFQRLSPICTKLVKFHSIENVEELRRNLEKLDVSAFQEIKEYIIFPLRLVLRKGCKEELCIKCIDCMKFIFDNTFVLSWNLFADVFLQLFTLIGNPNLETLCNPSEELNYSVCKCISSLIHASKNEISDHLYGSDFAPALGHSLFVLTLIFKHQKSKTLRLAALKTLGALTYSTTRSGVCREEYIIVSAGDRLAAFVPGIVSSLHLVLSGDPTQGQAVTVLALHILMEFISTVLSDCYINDFDRKVPTNVKIEKFPVVCRDASWAKEAAARLEVVIGNILQLVSHDHWKVRLAVVKCAKKLLFNCSKTLENCIPLLLQVVVTLNVDSFEQVTSFSQSTIKLYADYIRKAESKTFLVIFKEEILKVSRKIMKAQISSTEMEILNLLKMLHGYICLLGSSVSDLLHSAVHLNEVLLGMLSITDFDCSGVNIMHENSVTPDFSFNSLNVWPRKSFKHFQSGEIITHIISICQIFGMCKDASLVIDYLLDKLNNSLEFKRQSIYLIMWVVKGVTEAKVSVPSSNVMGIDIESPLRMKCEDNLCLISDILEEFFSYKHWNPDIYKRFANNERCIQSESYLRKSPDSICNPVADNESVTQICLLLEAVAEFSKGLNSIFKSFLTVALCPVMEKAGSVNVVVSHTGKMCLKCIALSCGYHSVGDLIFENCDYLVNSIAISFQQYIHKPEAAVVLTVALENCTMDILPIFRDTLQKLIDILDTNQNLRLPLLRVLYSVIVAIKHKVGIISKKNELLLEDNSTYCLSPDQIQHNELLKPMFLKYCHLKQTEMSFSEATVKEPFDSPNNSTECPLQPVSDNLNEYDLKASYHVELIVEILQRCIHLQSSKNLMLCLLSLDIIESGILALSDNSEKLHPLVNDIWKSFVLRFSNELVIAIKAFKILMVICSRCQDFVKSRTLKDVWPLLLSFLEKQKSVSFSKHKDPSYQFTKAFKYQLLLLSEMGDLAVKLEVNEKELNFLVSTCIPYLDPNQPELLQKAALKLIQDLGTFDPDAMWFYLNDAFSSASCTVPHPSFKSICFTGHMKNDIPLLEFILH